MLDIRWIRDNPQALARALVSRQWSPDAAEGEVRKLIDADEAHRLYERMPPGVETSGGSAANTIAGLAALGLRTGFVGQVAADQLGEVFTHDIRALGVDFATPPRNGEVPTARCLIMVTPDAQRTMNTFLGASQYLPSHALDHAQIEAGLSVDGQRSRNEAGEQRDGGGRHEQASRAAEQREKQALGDELPRQPMASGSERRPHGQFALAR